MIKIDNFGYELKNLRKEKGLSINDAARLSGVSQPHLSQIENNKRMPKVSVLRSLSEAYDITYIDILLITGHIRMEEIISFMVREYDRLFTKEEGQ